MLSVEGFLIVRQWFVAHRTLKRLSAAANAFRDMLLSQGLFSEPQAARLVLARSPQVYLCCRPERLGNFSFQAPALVERLGRVPPLIEALELTHFGPVNRFQPSLFGWTFVGPSSRSVSTSLPSSHSTASAV